jgi:tRNA-uridine 2-sulfurtransferase
VNKKAIALLSGGLDSSLAVKVILDLGIEVEALNFATVFSAVNRHTEERKNEACRVAELFGFPIRVIMLEDEYLDMIKNPKHGYGKNINPCIDCRIMLLRKAKEYMDASGASFIITGEVLGQRPMSQHRRALDTVESEAGVTGYLLRPLSAKLLPPTIPEQEGWVDREKLLQISGRSRKEQIQLAADYSLKDYPVPAGGCLLTDKSFAKKMRDIMERGDITSSDIPLLKVGRHLRLTNDFKLVVGRDENENGAIERLARPGDIQIQPEVVAGPVAVGQGSADEETLQIAARIVARYCDTVSDGPCKLNLKSNGAALPSIDARPMPNEQIETYRIC